jgi:glutaredoxin
VKADKAELKEMLKANGGVREVPTIVEDGQATVGYGGT